MQRIYDKWFSASINCTGLYQVICGGKIQLFAFKSKQYIGAAPSQSKLLCFSQIFVIIGGEVSCSL